MVIALVYYTSLFGDDGSNPSAVDYTLFFLHIVVRQMQKIQEFLKKINMGGLFLVYVTSGREKYEYHTEVVGLFWEQQVAEKELIRFLVRSKRLEAYDKEDGHLLDMSEIAETAMQQDNFDLHKFVKKYQNSYYRDGWKFDIQIIKPT